jgi:hypothetical protein
MRKKPLLFTIVPIILIGVCASFYFQTAFVLNTPLTNYQRILSKITLSNWVTMITMIVAGITIMRSSKWAKLFMPIAVFVVFWNNYLVATHTNNFTKTQITLAAILFMLVFAPLYSKRIQHVLSDRRHQWWKTAFRKKHKLPINVIPLHGDGFIAQTVDVSTTGLFVNVEQRDWATLPKIGEKVKLNLTLDDSKAVTCSAIVVRLAESNAFTPRGIGLQFSEFEGKTRKDLDRYLKVANTDA